MTPSALFRKGPVILIAAAALSGCGMVESDPHRFETLARQVADIRLSAEPSRDAPGAPVNADQSGLRPALRVEVLDPHALWDARDGGMRGFMESVGPAVAEAAAPVVVHALADETARVVTQPLRTATVPASNGGDAVIQLGAFSSEAAARQAWSGFLDGAAAAALSGLNPRYEPVQVNGRELVRLKVAAPAATAADICRAAQVSDPWCRAAGRV